LLKQQAQIASAKMLRP